MWQLSHAQIIDDEQRHGSEVREKRLPGPIERRVGEFFEQRVRFAVEDAIALLDHRAANRLGEMTFPGPWWPEQERILTLRDETAGGEVVDQCAIHLLVEIEIEAVE